MTDNDVKGVDTKELHVQGVDVGRLLLGVDRICSALICIRNISCMPIMLDDFDA